MGVNPRRISSWSSTLDKIRSRMAPRKGKFLSQGGRITLINAVLTKIPIYHFSFYREPKAIIHDIIKIQRNFF